MVVERLRLDVPDVLRDDVGAVHVGDRVREELTTVFGSVDGAAGKLVTEIQPPVISLGELGAHGGVVGGRTGVVRELERRRHRQAGRGERGGGAVHASGRPCLAVLSHRTVVDDVVLGVDVCPEELEVIGADSIVWIRDVRVLVGVAVHEQCPALAHHVLERADHVRCVRQGGVDRGAVVVHTVRVPVTRVDRDGEWHLDRREVVGHRAEFGRIRVRADVLDPDERAVPGRCSRGEHVEEEVRQGDVTICRIRVGIRDLTDIGEVVRPQGPGEGRPVGADRLGEHRRLGGVHAGIGHDPAAVGGVPGQTGVLVADLGDGGDIELGPVPAVRGGEGR